MNSILRKLTKAAAAMGFAMLGLGVFGPSAALADVRCVAEAETITGRDLESTRAAVTRPRARAACAAAVARCERRLDQLRRTIRLALPFARCRVIRRARVGGAGGRGRFRCVAEATTGRGRPIPNTIADAVGGRQRGACARALQRCEARLDEVRFRTGRPRPNAACDVIARERLR